VVERLGCSGGGTEAFRGAAAGDARYPDPTRTRQQTGRALAVVAWDDGVEANGRCVAGLAVEGTAMAAAVVERAKTESYTCTAARGIMCR
jgi:hypothetical protein